MEEEMYEGTKNNVGSQGKGHRALISQKYFQALGGEYSDNARQSIVI